MRVSYKWLSQYIDLSDVSPQDLAEKLTRAGVEVEAIESRNDGLERVVVGYIQDCRPHPNADKLSLCQVDLGEPEPVQIVCGAPNVRQGQKVPVAKVGAVLPGNVKIKKAKLRGEVSEGMICSAEELGIDERLVPAEYRGGIMVLPEDSDIGSDALARLDLDDHILELELTPNRSDCLSMIGVAYEVGAILDREVHPPRVRVEENQDNIEDHVQVEINAPDLCGHYVARKVRQVKIGPSPLWLQNRLLSAGIRPINNVVDVTNYVMMEYGQPLHAFDARKVQDGRIIVRRADDGEQVVTLDDKERTLKKEMLVIADPQKVIAVAGVMGAANSEVTPETTEIILESAYFAGESVRLTSKALDLRSEASLRFEKGVDPEGIYAAVDRAATLIAEFSGGEIVRGISEHKVADFPRKDISLNIIHLNEVLGTSLTPQEVTRIFDRLTFDYEYLGHEIRVEIPTRRQDLQIEEDLMEEVARLYGYDHIPTTLPKGVTTPGSRTERQKLRQKVRRYLQGAGLQQVLTYSLTNRKYADWGSLFNEQARPIGLSMPMSAERSHLRTTLVPHLLEVLRYNKNRRMEDAHIFEIGNTYLTGQTRLQELPEEKEVVSGAFTGLWQHHPWQNEQIPVDFYVVKGVIEGLLAKLGIAEVIFETYTREGYHPGRTSLLKIGDDILGLMGQIHPQVQQAFELDAVYVFELDVDVLLNHLPGEITFRSLPKYPSIERDMALIVDRHIPASHLIKTIKEAGAPLLQSVHVFDVYEGEHVPDGKKSIAFSLVYQEPERTLTDEEVSQIQARMIRRLASEWQAELRH